MHKNYKILTDSNTYTLSRILINTKFPITNLNTFFFEKGYYGYYTYPKNFNPLDYDIVFSSSLIRARETLKIITGNLTKTP